MATSAVVKKRLSKRHKQNLLTKYSVSFVTFMNYLLVRDTLTFAVQLNIEFNCVVG